MNPIPLTVFATIAGLSLASMAFYRHWNERQAGLKKAIRYLFLGFLFSILGLFGSAVLGNIGQLSYMPTEAKNLVYTLDNIFSLTCLFFSSAYIWSGGGYIVAYKSGKVGTVFKSLSKRHGYVLFWLLIALIAYYFINIRYPFYLALIPFLSVLVLLFSLFNLRNKIIRHILRGILLIRPFNYISEKFIDFLNYLLNKVDNLLHEGLKQTPRDKNRKSN